MSTETVSSASLDAARTALRLRQGLGARYDAANAPVRELGWARRGAAYFARKLNELSDESLQAPSRVPGWTRQHVAAWVAYHARAFTRLTERARTGADLKMFETPAQREEEIADGGTLPPGALRHLVTHAEIHLNVEWRDLGESDWDRPLGLSGDEPATVRQTAWLRAREIWLQAVNLDNGGTLRDAPADFLRALVEERLQALHELDPALAPAIRHDGTTTVTIGDRAVAGPLHEIGLWLCGCKATLKNPPDEELTRRIAALGAPVFAAHPGPNEKEISDA